MADRKLPTGRLQRVVKPAATAASAGLRQAAAWARRDDERELQAAIKSAQQVADLMGDMKGAFMKIGQLLSFAETSIMPPEARDALASLQADAPPMDYALVAEVVEQELGGPPDKVFDWFSPVPMASASIGQVHSARLGDREVVVKVQYPGVAEAVAADLNNAGLMAALARTIQPFVRLYMGRLDIKALIDEVRERILEELDYVSEAANQRDFVDLYRGHPTIRIPEVVDDRSTGRVLTSAYHDGMRYAAAVEQEQALRDQWGEAITRFAFGSIYRHGIGNTDSHPGNYLFHEDGAVTFLDFGSVRRFTPEQVAHIRAVGRAALADDAGAFATAMQAAGFMPRIKPEQGEAVWAAMRPAYLSALGPQPFMFTVEATRAMIDAQLGVTDEYRRIARDFEMPAHYLFLGRVSIGTFSVLTGLRASADWRSILEEMWAE